MGLATVVIDRRDAKVHMPAKNVLEVSYPCGQTQRIGLLSVKRLLIHGDVLLSSSLLRCCQENGIGIVLLSARGRSAAAHHFAVSPGAVGLRIRQFKAHIDPCRRLALAKRLVRQKIAMQIAHLETVGILDHGLARFTDSLEHAGHISEVLGVEGAAAARYFGRWRHVWTAPWTFQERTRRPPTDPVNALLSLSYTMALNNVGQLAANRGLDVHVGFLHSAQSGRPALALDLIEPLRPRIDHWVWSLMRQGQLLPEHFTRDGEQGVRLVKEGRALYYAQWFEDEQAWLTRAARSSLALVLDGLREKNA